MKKKNMTRREFLECMGMWGGLGAAYCEMARFGQPPPAHAHTGPPQPDSRSGDSQHIVILGAGIAGLCTAYLLRNTRFKITMIEPNPYVGGRCLTLRKGDIVREEGADRYGHSFDPLICDFDEGADFYFNSGPGRIPQSHAAILHYCKKLKIKLQPYIFACRSNLLQNDDFKQGRPIPLRWIKHDLRGYIAELLMQSAYSNTIDSHVRPHHRKAFIEMLRYFGDIRGPESSPAYKGSRRAGYRQKPGAGMQTGIPRAKFDLDDLLDSEFWKSGLFSDMYLYWQTSLMQAEGGMDGIPQAFRKNLGPNTTLHLNRKATGISRKADRILITHTRAEAPITADYCIATMAPPLLSKLLDSSFEKRFKASLSNITMVPAFKFGWQARSRFWEEENEIYGGISWTRHIISQIWYPSFGFQAPKGVLTGAYTYGKNARILGALSHQERSATALEGGEKLHPGQFKRNVEKGLSIAWQNIPHQAGAWAYYRNQARNPDYLEITKPQGRLLLAGDYFSFLPGWMEGAIRSAELVVEKIVQSAGE
jgi:monoamine oxidase